MKQKRFEIRKIFCLKTLVYVVLSLSTLYRKGNWSVRLVEFQTFSSDCIEMSKKGNQKKVMSCLCIAASRFEPGTESLSTFFALYFIKFISYHLLKIMAKQAVNLSIHNRVFNATTDCVGYKVCETQLCSSLYIE